MDPRVSQIERDLGRLEGIVDQLIKGIIQDRETVKEQRVALTAAIEASNLRSERLIEGLAEQIKKLAEADSKTKQIDAKQSGQWALGRWLLGPGLALVALGSGYLSGRISERVAVPSLHLQPAPHQTVPVPPGMGTHQGAQAAPRP